MKTWSAGLVAIVGLLSSGCIVSNDSSNGPSLPAASVPTYGFCYRSSDCEDTADNCIRTPDVAPGQGIGAYSYMCSNECVNDNDCPPNYVNPSLGRGACYAVNRGNQICYARCDRGHDEDCPNGFRCYDTLGQGYDPICLPG